MPEIIGLPIPEGQQAEWPRYIVRGDGASAVINDLAHLESFLAYEWTPPIISDVGKARAELRAKARAEFLAKKARART